jgi:small subunit ribosomal protein S4
MRYTGPSCRQCRREGTKLFLKGTKCFTEKCPVERRPYAPGQHGRTRVKESEYRTQLQEKQKARYTYGVLEKQFRKYYELASRRPGKTGDNLLSLLESRLDNVVYRAGLARTRRHARQLVTHGHFLVNGRKVDIPSFQVTQYDTIDVREKSLEMTPFIVARETHGERIVPAWLEALPTRMRILVHQLPVREQIDIPVQEQLIVEYYSKK